MDTIFMVLLAGLTSTLAYQGTKRLSARRATALADAVRALLDWIGVFVLFLAANLTLGVILIFLIRGLTPRFVALHALQNLLLLILSAAQSFVFQYWWKND